MSLESKIYPSSPEFVAQAHVSGRAAYDELYKAALDDPEKFFGDLAAKELHWFSPWTKTFEWEEPFAKWFVGGTTNVSYNCLDRHLATQPDKAAIIWEGEPGETRTITYAALQAM